MDCQEILSAMKADILQKVASAAAGGETQQILTLGRKLDLVDKLLQRTLDLEREITKLLTADQEVPTMVERSRREGETGREGGENARAAMIQTLSTAGIRLTRVKGATYKLQTGALLGIAYATERQPNRWFLGLTRGRFDHAILLCEESPERVHPLFLSAEFLASHRLSASGDGIKFNVTRSGNLFHLNIPGEGALTVPIFDVKSEESLRLLGN